MNIAHLFTNIKNTDRKRVGRGTGGSGGKTAGRGTKGQNARGGAGRKIQQWFEGGQTPLYRKLAKKRGSHNMVRGHSKPVTVTTDVINRLYTANETVSLVTLLAKKVIRQSELNLGVKIVARSPLKFPLNFEGVRRSESLMDKPKVATASSRSKV